MLGSERGPFGTGPEQLYACLRKLAMARYEEKVPIDVWPNAITEGIELRGHRPDGNYSILLTAAPQGSIPAHIWRRAFVIFL